jgi:RNA polymerase sigma factor (sigma-70 family)
MGTAMTKDEVYAKIEEHCRANFESNVKKMSARNGTKHDAEDIIQETYCRALKYWATFTEDVTFDGWIYRLMSNAARDHWKAEKLRGATEKTYLKDHPNGEVPPTQDFGVRLLEVKKLIKDRPDNIRRVLELSLLHQYNATEVAEIVPESAVNVRKIVQRFRDDIKTA